MLSMSSQLSLFIARTQKLVREYLDFRFLISEKIRKLPKGIALVQNYSSEKQMSPVGECRRVNFQQICKVPTLQWSFSTGFLQTLCTGEIWFAKFWQSIFLETDLQKNLSLSFFSQLSVFFCSWQFDWSQPITEGRCRPYVPGVSRLHQPGVDAWEQSTVPTSEELFSLRNSSRLLLQFLISIPHFNSFFYSNFNNRQWQMQQRPLPPIHTSISGSITIGKRTRTVFGKRTW